MCYLAPYSLWMTVLCAPHLAPSSRKPGTQLSCVVFLTHFSSCDRLLWMPKDEGRLKSTSYTSSYLVPLGNRRMGYTLRKIFILRVFLSGKTKGKEKFLGDLRRQDYQRVRISNRKIKEGFQTMQYTWRNPITYRHQLLLTNKYEKLIRMLQVHMKIDKHHMN